MIEPTRFVVPRSLLDQLRDYRERRLAATSVQGSGAIRDEVEDREDAFLLDPGMGPMTYLTADGRVLEDHRWWFGDECREATLDGAIRALVVGAKKTGLSGLLGLVPVCPDDGSPCPHCKGDRWEKPWSEMGLEVVCGQCHGRGWVNSSSTAAQTGSSGTSMGKR